MEGSMARIAINGLGRMGKLALRDLFDRGMGDQIVLLNDAAGDPGQHALLIDFDSVHGRWSGDTCAKGDSLVIRGHEIPLAKTKVLNELPLAELGVDLVIDCTGAFKTASKLAPYFDAGVRKVVVSAPVKESEAANIVYGVNHRDYDAGRHRIVTAASCTTNCLAPVVQVMLAEFGIRHGVMTTIHDVTNTQTIIDRPAKDMRRARSALMNLIPTTTGSATAITLIFPELKGRLNGHAVRVPLLNASLTDCVFEVERPVTAAEVNAAFETWAKGPLQGILGYETRPLVSSDYTHDRRSSVIDAPSTMVVDGTQVKVFAWYDNEWGYACRLCDVAQMVAESL
jgi:glyceraldehyde 3-phosphate dehydrogenase